MPSQPVDTYHPAPGGYFSLEPQQNSSPQPHSSQLPRPCSPALQRRVGSLPQWFHHWDMCPGRWPNHGSCLCFRTQALELGDTFRTGSIEMTHGSLKGSLGRSKKVRPLVPHPGRKRTLNPVQSTTDTQSNQRQATWRTHPLLHPCLPHCLGVCTSPPGTRRSRVYHKAMPSPWRFFFPVPWTLKWTCISQSLRKHGCKGSREALRVTKAFKRAAVEPGTSRSTCLLPTPPKLGNHFKVQGQATGP